MDGRVVCRERPYRVNRRASTNNSRARTGGRTDHFIDIFLLWLRTLTFELDLDSVTINQRVRYLDHLVEKLLAGHTDRPTDKHTPDDCYSWTTRVTSLAVNW